MKVLGNYSLAILIPNAPKISLKKYIKAIKCFTSNKFTMRKTIYVTLFVLLPFALSAQQLEAYAIYDKDGQKTNFYDMAEKLSEYDIVLFGEHHNNSINHWLQLKLTEALYDLKDGALVLGAEMFERDNQEGIDLYLAQEIDATKLADTVRLWSNFTTDYKPL